MKSARRRSREFALQGIYAWQMAHSKIEEIAAQLATGKGFARADAEYFRKLLRGAVAQAEELEKLISPQLDRGIDSLSPVERGILMLGAYELRNESTIPFRVVINEAVELAKTYGGTDGHKYVNAVLNGLAATLRPAEVEADRAAGKAR